MDRERLERYLREGLSLECIGKSEGKHPSTIGYWLKRYGLNPSGSEHGRRVEIDDHELRELAAEGLTLAAIADRLGASESTVSRRLTKLRIRRRSASRKQLALDALAHGERHFEATCTRHGETTFHAITGGKSRCAKCNSEAVMRCRRKRKNTLAAEAGGRCVICGFDRCLAALQFHHLDPREKRFGIAQAGVTRALEECRTEARKCVLVCANCHAALEVGEASLPVELKDDDAPG